MSLSDVQRRLSALGYYSGRIDGVYGPGTDAGLDTVLKLVEQARGVVPAAPKEVVGVPTTLPANFDPDYRWIGTIGVLPRILTEAVKLYGITETPGAANNPTILAWAKETGLEKTYTADSIAWCGLFMAVVVKRAGYDPVAGPLWALNWLNFGVKADKPSLGDILCFERFDSAGKSIGGHVGLYVGEDSGYYHVLGGNTSDKVTIARLAKNRLRGARRPAYKNPMLWWKPYQLTTGGTISSNEA